MTWYFELYPQAQTWPFDFALKHRAILGLSVEFLASLRTKAREQGAEFFLETHLVFPPRGGAGSITAPSKLQPGDLWSTVLNEATRINPCFSVYDIGIVCPTPLDALGFDGNDPDASPPEVNFVNDVPGFKAAIHAPEEVTWLECTDASIFKNGEDASPVAGVAHDLFRRVLERNERTLIAHGTHDFVLLSEGTLLGIQNTTWAGRTGFHRNPFARHFTVEGQSAGTFHVERKLAFATVAESGHMIPQFKPAAAFKLQQFLLGQIEEADLLRL